MISDTAAPENDIGERNLRGAHVVVTKFYKDQVNPGQMPAHQFTTFEH